jgi:hypothetical protein
MCLRVCVYIYTYVYTNIYIYIYTHIHIYIYKYIYTQVHTYTHGSYGEVQGVSARAVELDLTCTDIYIHTRIHTRIHTHGSCGEVQGVSARAIELIRKHQIQHHVQYDMFQVDKKIFAAEVCMHTTHTCTDHVYV